MSTTATTVSRTLGKRFTRSTSTAGRVKGYRSTSRGFTVKQHGEAVMVEWETGRVGMDPAEERQVVAARLLSMGTHLRAAGFNAEVIAPNGESALHRALRVTKEA